MRLTAPSGSTKAGAAFPGLAAALVLIWLLAFVPPVWAEEVVWFSPSLAQVLSSKITAPPPEERESGVVTASPDVFMPPKGLPLPYTIIRDNTEGPAAFADVIELFPQPRAPGAELLLLDVGAGRSDAPRKFVEASLPNCRVVSADPYNRSEAENARAQRTVEAAGGADVATSMSVLNVVQEKQARVEHIGILHKALRPGGIAFFKVWPGLWPERGSNVPIADASQGTFQANAWAAVFLPEVEEVFGHGSAYADNNLNLIAAVRR